MAQVSVPSDHFERHIDPRPIQDKRFRIIMIPGNPGLIAFYKDFLNELAASLEAKSHAAFTVQGHSLGGFSVETREPDGPLSLREQIEYVENQVNLDVEAAQSPQTQKIILIGHSVGAYILLELLRRHYALRKERELPYHIVGGICLFPTVVDIAQSKSGRRATRLLNLPLFPFIASFMAMIIIRLLPEASIRTIVQKVTGFPDDALTIVVSYLQSSMGLHQTLHMARDEMEEIKADRWNEKVWGSAATAPEQRSKLFFYFGEEDHWVADQTRDDLIAARALRADDAMDWKPRIEIDREGTPHGFCIRESYMQNERQKSSSSQNVSPGHSEPIAKKCADYIKKIVA